MHACSVAKSCPIVCGPMDYSPPNPLLDFPGKNTGVGCHFLLQGIFMTQGSNPYLLHCQACSFTTEPLGKTQEDTQVLPTSTWEVTLTGNRVLADVIKLRILKGDHPELRMDSKCNDFCPYKWKERKVEDGAWDGVMLPHAKGHQQPGEVGETRKGLLS